MDLMIGIGVTIQTRSTKFWNGYIKLLVGYRQVGTDRRSIPYRY